MNAHVPSLVAAACGAFCALTLCWIVWGVLTPGDYFANGHPLVYPTLALAAIGGAWLARKVRSRLKLGLLVGLSALCAVFWVAAPNGWWAKALPGSGLPGAPPGHVR